MSSITTSYIYFSHQDTLKKEKVKIKKEYIKLNKDLIQININEVYDYLNNKNKKLKKSLKMEVREQTYNAYNMMSSIYNEFKDTKTKEEITLIIKTALKSLKFKEGREYYFIYDLDGNNIFHPILPDREGKNFLNTQDVNGKFIIQESISIAKSEKKEGFLNWMFPKPFGTIKEYKKIGFIKNFEPYNWFVGIGEYEENLDNQLKKEILEYLENLKYKNDEYIFLVDKNGDLLITRSKLSNINEIDKKNSFVKQFDDFVNSKEENIYLEYEFENDKKHLKKISYLKKVEIFDWVIGTGFNLDNLNLKIVEKQKELELNYNKYIKITLIVTLIMTILLMIISMYLSELLRKKFVNYKNSLENQKITLLRAQHVAHIGDWELNIETKKVYWSNEIIRIFGINSKDEDTFGLEFLKMIMIKEDESCYEDALINCINIGKEFKCIFRIKRPDNEIRWIETRGKRKKNKLSIVGTIQDITENKNLEIEKQEKDEILYQQSKMAAMGEMIGNIAHQWRQPLSVISTASTGAKMQKEMGLLSDEQLFIALSTINTSAQYLSTTIDDFKNFFNPKNNKISKFKISDTFTKTLSLINARFISKEIEIIQNIKNFELKSIENELIQVLINILNNAQDELVKKVNQRKLIFINTYVKDNISYIEILDNAGGINKEIINRIFEPYFSTKFKSQGTGIGLYMSKEIIEKHLNGKIYATNDNYIFENKEYVGAKFILEI